jgi:hypothetical protein
MTLSNINTQRNLKNPALGTQNNNAHILSLSGFILNVVVLSVTAHF